MNSWKNDHHLTSLTTLITVNNTCIMSAIIHETKLMFKALAAQLKAPYPIKRAHYDFTRNLIQVRHSYPEMDTRQLSYVKDNYYAIAQIMSADFGYDDPFPFLDTLLRIAGHLPPDPSPVAHPVSITVDDDSSVDDDDYADASTDWDAAITETETEIIIDSSKLSKRVRVV